MQAKSWHYSTVSLRTHTHTQSVSFSVARALSLSLPLSLYLSLSLFHTHTHTYARVCSRMLAYARVCSRMVEWLQFGDVRHDTAVSLYPTIASLQYISPPLHVYRFLDITYRLRHTDIASFTSDIGYTDR